MFLAHKIYNTFNQVQHNIINEYLPERNKYIYNPKFSLLLNKNSLDNSGK
jgi:hypothetical protein